MMQDFSTDELRRYDRHLSLAEIGLEGQRRLKNAAVLIVGLGGLGSPAALYLAAAGVGRLGLLDFDSVDDSNLQRQILYSTQDAGRSKAEAAAERLKDLNPHIRVDVLKERFDPGNARRILAAYDIVLDGADNFPTRYLVNDACFFLKKPLIAASILSFEGQLSVFSEGGPCYRCMYPEPPPEGAVPSCAEGGVLGVLPGVMGSLQATEALKWILKIGEPLQGRLLLYDALTMAFSDFKIRRNPDCALCGNHPSILELKEVVQACAPAEAVQEVSASELKSWMKNKTPYVLIDVREDHEVQTGSIDGAQFLPLDRVLSQNQLPFSKSDVMIFYCRSGQRSRKAALHAAQLGYADVYSLAGGILSWSK